MEHFQEINFIGKGGFGAAYVYKDKRTNSKVVLKIVDMKQATAKERDIANKEVNVLKTIKHPNIVQYQESFHDGWNLCIVMEYCEGGDLFAKITSAAAPFTEQQIWNWFSEICQALKYLHGRKIIHRDLKPPNIFLTKENSVRLGDFGLAKILDFTAAYMRTTGGTVSFTPPEMVLNEPYNNKIDIWALGVTLYHMTARELPFYGHNLAAIVMKIAQGTYKPLTGYSKDLCSLVDKLLVMKPRDRPSITEVLQLPEVRKHAAPVSRLHNIYQYRINDQGQLCDLQGNRFQYNVHDSKVDNTLRYEGIAHALEEYLYERMESLGLKRLPVPTTASTIPDYDNPGTFIFASEDWDTCEKLVIFIHGSGDVKAGQWTRRLMINNSLNEGTQIPYIEKARARGYGVLVLNTNDNKPDVKGCQNAPSHGVYVWANYIKNAEATHIAVKAHSAGGSVTRAVMAKFPQDFKSRVYANAFTGVNGTSYSDDVVDYAKKVTRNWVTSGEPIGTPVQVSDCACQCVSAGTEIHEETPYKACQQVFDFIEKRFCDTSPGNL